jgi:hypothetical protein
MRASRILRPPVTPPEPESASALRIVLWSAVAVALLIGIALYFKYERFIPSVL